MWQTKPRVRRLGLHVVGTDSQHLGSSVASDEGWHLEAERVLGGPDRRHLEVMGPIRSTVLED